jgi:N-acetylneuraminic acid mutarotase
MKKVTPVLFLLLLFACKKHNGTSTSSGTWTQTSTFSGTSITDPVGFAIGSRLYIGMGAPIPGTERATSFYAYDENANAWSAAASYPYQTGGTSGIGFAIGGTGYVLLSRTTTAGELYSYDTATNSWTKMADFPGEMLTTTSAFSLNGKAYVGFGTSPTATNTFYQYDPAANTWSNVKDFPGIQYEGTTCFVIGNYAYVATGAEANQVNGLSYTAQSYRYDAASDSWAAIANFPGTPRLFATGFSVGNMGYIIGGLDSSGNFLKDVWQYDPNRDKWLKQADFPGAARGVALGFSGTNAAYFGFGHDAAGGYADFWEFKP